jgi:uncharacterized protein (DUF1800 family)
MALRRQRAQQATEQKAAAPPPEIIALNRMAYGPRPEDPARVASIGVDAYIDEQLNPSAINDADCEARLAAARLRIRYGAGTGYAARNELLPLDLLDSSVPALWDRRNFANPMGYPERMRPWEEVRVAAVIRAVYSRRQLQEVLVEFWHNHFNVNASSDASVSVAFPVYDRIMRQHCFGNFRAFLEDVAQSTAMLYYLDNVSNRVSGGEGGNENFARELFELHTLGSDNYLKFYDDRRNIGTITYNGETFARGYIDEDVYEAARCLTGWTVANGYYTRPAQNDGTFLYDPSWHDTNPKTVLSPDGFPNIPRNQPDLKDGRDVLDLLANHPGTARHLCTKLARRLISDTPPQSVVDAAVAEWMAHRGAPDQIRQVVRVILRSAAFTGTWGQKIKRPFEALISYLRATGAEISLSDAGNPEGSYWSNLFYQLAQTGHRIFEWPTPTGHPDVSSHWLSTNGMLRRWNLPYWLGQTATWGGNVALDLRAQTDAALPNGTVTQIVDYWIDRLCGYTLSATTRQELLAFMAQGGSLTAPPQPTSGKPDYNDANAVTERLNSMVQLLVMSPEFQSK